MISNQILVRQFQHRMSEFIGLHSVDAVENKAEFMYVNLLSLKLTIFVR